MLQVIQTSFTVTCEIYIITIQMKYISSQFNKFFFQKNSENQQQGIGISHAKTQKEDKETNYSKEQFSEHEYQQVMQNFLLKKFQ